MDQGDVWMKGFSDVRLYMTLIFFAGLGYWHFNSHIMVVNILFGSAALFLAYRYVMGLMGREKADD
jgi:hypothetical protein